MEVQLRQQRSGADGITEYADTVVSAPEITIGSAPDQQIQLLGRSVAPQHAVIRPADGGLVITARGRARLLINRARSRSARLQPGDVIEIERHRINVTAPAPGFDLALSIEPDTAVKKSELENAFRTELDQTWLSRRRTAWALVLLTPILIFVIPLGTTLMRRHSEAVPGWLIDEAFWSAGPLTPAHALAAGQHCEACHRDFFVPVQDVQCRKCHENVVDHITARHRALTRLGPKERCGACHEEHNSQNGSLVVRADRLCIRCHARSAELFGSLQVSVVDGFSQDGHPAFKATVFRPTPVSETDIASLSDPAALLTPAGAQPLLWRPERVAVQGGRESSNLKFSHAEHLGPRVPPRRADAKNLQCADCHVLEADGAHFAPITWAKSCAGSACHDLTFDREAPDRQLPHGKPRDAILLLEDYFAHKVLEPVVEHGPPRRVLPDAASSPAPACEEGSLVARGNCLATREVLTQFTVQGCVTCHEVKDNHAAELVSRFTVMPVRLIGDYLPGVHFSHRAHAVQKNLTGQAACLSCHAALQAEDTTHLMIPDKEKCLECHAESAMRDRVQLECISCHAYHADVDERLSQHT